MNWFVAFPLHDARVNIPAAPPRVRTFAVADLHLTCVFMGAVSEGQARAAYAVATRLAKPLLQPRALTFTHVEALGPPKKPSAFAAIPGDGRAEIEAVITAVRTQALRVAGLEPDPRPPLAHMTFARPQRRAADQERTHAWEWAKMIDVTAWRGRIGELALYTWSAARDESLFQIVG